MRHRQLFVLPLLATAALAQSTQVIPASLTNTDGPGSTSFPFGLSSPARVQTYFAASETGILAAAAVRSLEVRANANATTAAKSSIDLQITLSTTPATLATLVGTFAANHGTNAVVAYTRKLTNLAALPASNPGGYGGVWMLDAPFVYIPAQGNLLIDYDVASQPSGAWTVDSPFTSTAATHTTTGAACNGLTADSTGGLLGQALTYSVTGGPANAAAVLMFGPLFPAPVPFPGLPGCNVYVNPIVGLTVPLDGAGAGSLPLTVPESAGLRGATLSAQFASTHTAGLAFSAARSVTFAAFAAARITNTTTNTSPTGSVQLRSAIVVRLGV